MTDKIILGGDRIYSYREGVNVLYPFGRNPDNWNHHYRPVNRRLKSESIQDYLRDIVRETLNSERPGWLDRVTEIVIRDNTVCERGLYHWTAYGEPVVCYVSGPQCVSTFHPQGFAFVSEQDARQFINSKCIGNFYRPAEFSITMV